MTRQGHIRKMTVGMGLLQILRVGNCAMQKSGVENSRFLHESCSRKFGILNFEYMYILFGCCNRRAASEYWDS